MNNPMMNNPMMNNPMMNNNMMNNPMMNNNMMNNNMMNNNMMNSNQMNNNMGQNMSNATLARLTKEFKLCKEDNDLIQIGCNFGLVNENNFYEWRVTMVGPRTTPYEGGLFTILITFPYDYPLKGPEFKFKNKIYHLNVDFSNKDFGHICINSLNEWRTTGKVTGKPGYAVKQALFDIFCLFYNQGIDSAYDETMAKDYRDNPEKFNEVAKKWVKEFAPLC